VRTRPTSAYSVASRFVGTTEVDGNLANPQILAMLQLDQRWPSDDAVPWCSAFVNYVAWLMDLPRSGSLRARSWLTVGQEIHISQAEQGFDVVIFKRGDGVQPGPSELDAPGHVAWFDQITPNGRVRVLGGNQGDTVSYAIYPLRDILGVRRLA
jgi:uncharacterized protein (TIGR02594 family)